ncbi:MAG: bifunctional 4-hydroxy-2-oxoglutarate aldolase/2-dehydro-3-deoxy-phosphogluconate aldolase, partial [Nitrospiraceae bacterium]|nr:bifunctional 4-hydroxy-2-oxoglutarate aldolase/2-dehydro-3-deoxy-phosphogluconate aldolase [Nitrospiraceae bacterium]
MDKYAAIQYLLDNGIVAIIRADSGGRELVRVVEAIAQGGVRCIELSMTTPDALACIEAASQKLADAGVMLGVGTVLDPETCRMAVLAGAEFVVTPALSVPVIEMARRYAKPIAAGAFTPTEILTAWEAGADFIKVFPSSIGGPGYIKAVKGPLPQIPLIPTGGVELSNVGDFIKAGASVLAVGGGIVSTKLLATGDLEGITRNAAAFAAAVREAR